MAHTDQGGQIIGELREANAFGAEKLPLTVTEDLEPEPFTYDENGGARIKIVEYAQTSKFLPDDRVWYRANGTGTREGPYVVANVHSPKKYRLAAVNDMNILVLAGRTVDEDELEEVKA